MARTIEPAVRLRLVPDTEAIVGRSGVHFLRGRETFFLDGRGVRRLVETLAPLLDPGVDFDALVSRLLRAEGIGEPAGVRRGRERGAGEAREAVSS